MSSFHRGCPITDDAASSAIALMLVVQIQAQIEGLWLTVAGQP
jgi:hypothetical protein